MPLPHLILRAGSIRDYDALAAHHYLADRPATVSRVLVLVDPTPTPTDRFLGRPAPGSVAAVLVESRPILSCRLREQALGGRYAAIADPARRAAVVNEEVRCISRVVVDPRWRGAGLAVRLVAHALATATTPVTEALAAMGHVHPFFERAGMTAHERPPLPSDARLIDALQSAGLPPLRVADVDASLRHIAGLPDGTRRWLESEIQRWHRRTERDSRGVPLRDVLTLARGRLWRRPVYFVKVRENA